MIILILSLFFILSCAPLRPLSPDSPKGYTRYMPNAASQPSPAKYEQKPESITGIDTWDRVLLPWLGTPYLSGGNTKSGADCSGFVSSVYREKEGVYIPRTTSEEFKMGTSIDKKDLIVGDLVFFGEYTRINHVGIYVGNGNFIHASTSNGVMISPLDDIYWKPRYVGARRYF